MHDEVAAVRAWLDAGDDPIVVRAPLTQGIAGAGRGEALAFGHDGQSAGALLGGAVDDVARGLADEVRASGRRQVATVEISPQLAETHALTSGGLVTVVADRAALLPVDWRGGRTPVAFTGPMGAGGPIVSITDDHAGTFVADAAERVLRGGRSGALLVDETSLVEVYVPITTVVVVGDGQVAIALEAQAALLGWSAEATNDPRVAVAALGRLGPVDAIVVVSHDHGVDTPVLHAALETRVGYLGALGSRRTQARRREDLLAAGVHPDALEAIHGPAGLDLGASTPAEIALSICAEILAACTGRSARPLHATSGPIRP